MSGNGPHYEQVMITRHGSRTTAAHSASCHFVPQSFAPKLRSNSLAGPVAPLIAVAPDLSVILRSAPVVASNFITSRRPDWAA